MKRRKEKNWFQFSIILLMMPFIIASQLIPYIPCMRIIWSWSIQKIVDILRAYPNYCSIVTFLNKETGFLGTAVWTLTTVLSAFMVMYYSQQSSTHYGVATRKIIGYSIGSCTIPLYVIINISIVLLMTRSLYLMLTATFYYHAISSIGVQLIVAGYCVYLTSDWHNIKCLNKRERKSIHNRSIITNCDERSASLIPIVLQGDEINNDKIALIIKMIVTVIRDVDIPDNVKLSYVDETYHEVAKWIEINGENQDIIYQLTNSLLKEFNQRLHLTYDEHDCKNILDSCYFVVCLVRATVFRGPFSELLTYVFKTMKEKFEEKDKAVLLAYIRTVIEYVYQNESKRFYDYDDDIRRWWAEEIKFFFIKSVETEKSDITLYKEDMERVAKHFLTQENSTEPDKARKTILAKIKQERYEPDYLKSERADERLRMLITDDSSISTD